MDYLLIKALSIKIVIFFRFIQFKYCKIHIFYDFKVMNTIEYSFRYFIKNE